MEKKTPEACWCCGKRIVKGRPIFILRGTIIRCCSLACLAYASLNIDEETSTGYIEEEEDEDGNKNN
mgnify:FL=1|jgi:hypothetical protein